MKKTFTLLIALAAAFSAGAYNAQEVSSVEEIVDGGVYAIINMNPSGNRIFTISEDGSTASFQTFSEELTAIINPQCHWTFTKTSDHTCAHTSYTSDNHVGIFFISNNGNYWSHTTAATLPTTTTPGAASTYFELIKHSTTPSALTDDGSTYFSILGNWNSTNSVLEALIVLDTSGSVNMYTRASASNDFTSSNYYSEGYSEFYKIYRIVKTASDYLAEAKTEYIAQLLADPQKYGVADAMASYVDQINALTASTDAELTAAKAKMEQIIADSKPAFKQAVVDRFNGRYVTLRNVANSTYYITMENTAEQSDDLTGIYAERATDAAAAAKAIWQVQAQLDESNDYGFSIKLTNPYTGIYFGNSTLSTTSGHTALMSDNADTALDYKLIGIDSSATKFFIQYGDLYIHNNVTARMLYYTGDGDGSKWYIEDLTADNKATIFTALSSEASALTYSDGTATSTATDPALYGDGLNQITDPLGQEKANVIAKIAANGDFAEVCAALRTVKADASTLSSSANTGLNMPKAGSYIRVKAGPQRAATYSTGMAYLSTANNSAGTNAAVVTSLTSADDQLNTILYYSGENLAGYATGYFLRPYLDGTTVKNFYTNTTNYTPFNFSLKASTGELGCYLIEYTSSDTSLPCRYLYLNTSATDGGNFADVASMEACSSPAGYHLQLEYVESLPVTIDDDGIAALCLPVAVTTPSDADCFVATISGQYLKLNKAEAGATYAAGTPIFVKGTAGTTVTFTVASSGDESHVCDEFAGSYYIHEFTADTDNVTYIPGKPASTSEAAISAAPAMRRAADASNTATVSFIQASETLPANAPILTISKSISGTTYEPYDNFTLTLDPDQTAEDSYSLVSILTSITDLTVDAELPSNCYDLMGRRIASPRHGQLYIQGRAIRRN